MAEVKFCRGTSEEFEPMVKDPDTIYYLTDTKQMFMGEDEYCARQRVVVAAVTSLDSNLQAASVLCNLTPKKYYEYLQEGKDIVIHNIIYNNDSDQVGETDQLIIGTEKKILNETVEYDIVISEPFSQYNLIVCAASTLNSPYQWEVII